MVRYFRARQYVHASANGEKTLCGLQCNTFGCHWESNLWREVEFADFEHSPCPKCKKKKYKQVCVSGRQTTLKEDDDSLGK